MTRDELRAAAARVEQWHERFAGLFGRQEAQAHSLTYLKGLLSDQARKSVEPIALRFARSPDGGPATQNEVVAMQGFITASPWEAGDVFAEIQAVFAEERVPSAKDWPLGTVGIIDEAAFAHPRFSTDEAIYLVEYYLQRNRVAHESHRKSWLETHKRLKDKLLL